MPQELGNLEKVLRVGEGRRLKRLKSQAEYVAPLEPESARVTILRQTHDRAVAKCTGGTDVVVDAFLPLPGTGLELRAVLDGRASPHADAVTAPGLLAAGARATGEPSTRIALPVRRQADRLDLCLFAVWEPGAFDGRRYTSNAWKVAPEVEAVIAGHLQPTLVLEHEEWP